MISDAVLTAPADVLILPMTDDLSAAVSLASMLRAGGLRVRSTASARNSRPRSAMPTSSASRL